MRIKSLSTALFALLLSWAGGARADDIETAGTALAVTLPLFAGGLSLYKGDFTGDAQLVVETGLTVGTAYALKELVRERRPDGSDYHSFPSETTALAASGSAYLWGRYGWEYGLPALVVTEFVSYSRVESKQHHWYDTMASSALAEGYAYFVTTPFQRRDIYTELSALPDGAYARIAFNF